MTGFIKFMPCFKFPQKPVSIERRLKSWKIKCNFKGNQPYLSRCRNSLNSATGLVRVFWICLVYYFILFYSICFWNKYEVMFDQCLINHQVILLGYRNVKTFCKKVASYWFVETVLSFSILHLITVYFVPCVTWC